MPGEAQFRYAAYTVGNTDLRTDELAPLLGELGFDGVEWRVTPPTHPDRPEHLTLLDVERQAERVRAQCDKAGLDVPIVTSYEPLGAGANVEALIALAAGLGARLCRFWFRDYDRPVHYDTRFDDARRGLDEAVAVGKRCGVKPVVEVHLRTIVASPSATRRLLEAFSPDEAGAIYDPGNMVIEGHEEPENAVEILGAYLAHVHVKNARVYRSEDGSWAWDWCALDEGIADWPRVVRALVANGYSGYLSLEDFHHFRPEAREYPPEHRPERIRSVRATFAEQLALLKKLVADARQEVGR